MRDHTAVLIGSLLLSDLFQVLTLFTVGCFLCFLFHLEQVDLNQVGKSYPGMAVSKRRKQLLSQLLFLENGRYFSPKQSVDVSRLIGEY